MLFNAHKSVAEEYTTYLLYSRLFGQVSVIDSQQCQGARSQQKGRTAFSKGYVGSESGLTVEHLSL